MKALPFICLVAALLAACSPSSSDKSANDSTQTVSNTPPENPVNVVTWSELGVRETPDEKGKYLTSVYVGEHFDVTGDTASQISGGKRHHYHKVTLSDGKSGWVRDEFVGIGVYPAAILTTSYVLRRPDISTTTDKAFPQGTFVVVKRREGDFVEVSGKITGDAWYTTGFVREQDLSYDKLEVRFVTLNQRMEDEKKEDLKATLAAQLQDESTFGQSILWNANYNSPGYDSRLTDSTGDSSDEETDEDTAEDVAPLQLNPPQNALIAFYAMDDADVLKDDSGKGHNGTHHGVTQEADKPGYATGALGYRNNAYSSVDWEGDALQLPFTVVAYAQTFDINKKDQTILSMGRSKDGTGFNFGYTVKDSGQPVFYFGMIGVESPIGVEAPANIRQGEWFYLAASSDMQVMKIYVNGKLIGMTRLSGDNATAMSNNLYNSDEPLEIGRELSTLNRYFFGNIDAVAVWSRALSDAEVAGMNY